MKDIQNERDTRNIPINKVGVKHLKYPITILDKENTEQHTVASVNMYVDLPHHFKGTHMSRFIEILNAYRGMISYKAIRSILTEMKTRLDAESAHIELTFPYFIEKAAPITGAKALVDYRCTFSAAKNGHQLDFVLGVEVPITTLCPCSKAISLEGAHNQRGVVRVRVRFDKFIWIEDLVRRIERCGSTEVYALLKREDEKYVTEQAYANPVFVEDVVRNVTQQLAADENIRWFSVEAENFESIHNHNAYAEIISEHHPKKHTDTQKPPLR
ncbi:MAG: GTP cyclohydrolase I FolE2 [Gemmatimonadetes bacterium]|nr:MAG: GTP cyclohydrolase I FolE2 [Gemmatimonadota bacterium]